MADIIPSPPGAAAQERTGDSLRGFGFAMGAYMIWGLLPLYMKLVTHIPTLEVLAHRVLWSVPVALVILVVLGRTADLRAALGSRRMLGMAAVTAALVSVNWGIYVWAIQSGQALEAALGYYINPLISVLVARLVLGERLRPVQWGAVALAAAAVAILTIDAGQVPYIALGLSVTWACYAYLKKSLPIGPNQGFALEVILLTPPALAYAGWLMATGEARFLQGVAMDDLLLMGCGVVTAVPLMIYANGAKLLRLSTIAVLQYIVPTMVFLTAVFLFNEPFGQARAVAFPMIWTALVLYTWSMFRQSRGH